MTTTVIYGTQVTPYYTAFAAGGAPLNIAGGSVIVGDGNGVVPLLSQLIANGGCLDPIAGTGASIASVALNSTNSAQIDISIVVPATVNGVETGPFTVREFAIYDALGNLCAVGVTNLEKSTSGQGQIADLAWTASIVTAVAGAVIVTPPSSGFATVAQVQTFFNANLPTAAAPLTQTNTTNPQGWVERVFGIRPASQPVDPVTAPEDAAATGYGRPASAAEFSSGTPFGGGFTFPWPTLQQVHAALSAIAALIAAIPAYVSGTAITVDSGRHVNLDYTTLGPATPLLTDIFAVFRPAVGYFQATLTQLMALLFGKGPIGSGLLIVNSSATPNSVLDITAGRLLGILSFSATINSASSGAGGVDTGAIAPSTAYDLYAGVDPATGAATAWATVEGAAPTPPVGFTIYARVGWQRTDSAGNWWRIMQVEDEWWYQVAPTGAPNTTALPTLSSGAVGNVATGAQTAVSLAGVVPSKSIAVDVVIGATSDFGNATMLAPNPNYGGMNYTLGASPYVTSGDNNVGGASVSSRARIMFEEPPTLYIAAQSGAASYVSGGKINI